MKTKIQKEMRKIRIQLKQHDISEEKKNNLREKLNLLRIKDKEDKNNKG